ncbi:MAG: ATP-binding cassette domain-containing protein [Pseudomonadota bacterium]
MAKNIILSNITKRYEDSDVISDINIEVGEGSIFGFIGLTSSGKSTLAKIIAGLTRPSFGSVMLSDDEFSPYITKNRRRVAFVASPNGLPGQFNINKLGKYYKRIYPKFNENLFLGLLNTFSISSKAKISKVGFFNRKKLAIILALAQTPEIIVMDEPFSKLKTADCDLLKNAILDYKENNPCSIVIFTANPKYHKDLSDTIALLERGKIRCLINVSAIQGDYQKIILSPPKDYDPDDFKLEGVLRVDKVEDKISLIIFKNYNFIIEMLELNGHQIENEKKLTFSELIWAQAKLEIEKEKGSLFNNE